MSGHRQAAVALYGLAPEDRRLILDQLPLADQALLRSHLGELRALGFAPALAAAQPLAGVAPPQGAPLAARERLQAAQPDAMFALLEHEPAALVAQALALADWRWAAGLLERLPPARRDVIRATQPVAAPARGRFLMEALAARLETQPAALAKVAGPGAAPLWTPVWKRVRAWIR